MTDFDTFGTHNPEKISPTSPNLEVSLHCLVKRKVALFVVC